MWTFLDIPKCKYTKIWHSNKLSLSQIAEPWGRGAQIHFTKISSRVTSGMKECLDQHGNILEYDFDKRNTILVFMSMDINLKILQQNFVIINCTFFSKWQSDWQISKTRISYMNTICAKNSFTQQKRVNCYINKLKNIYKKSPKNCENYNTKCNDFPFKKERNCHNIHFFVAAWKLGDILPGQLKILHTWFASSYLFPSLLTNSPRCAVPSVCDVN